MRPGLDVESETQWRVTWFPPDQDEAKRTGSEAQVRKVARLKEEWNPIIEKREVIVQPWEIVENKALGVVEEVHTEEVSDE